MRHAFTVQSRFQTTWPLYLTFSVLQSSMSALNPAKSPTRSNSRPRPGLRLYPIQPLPALKFFFQEKAGRHLQTAAGTARAVPQALHSEVSSVPALEVFDKAIRGIPRCISRADDRWPQALRVPGACCRYSSANCAFRRCLSVCGQICSSLRPCAYRERSADQ